MSLRVRLCALSAAAMLSVTAASAHHPGSHAARTPEGRVKLDVATTGDGCTSIDSVAAGSPPGIAPPPEAEPVTVRLARPNAICTMELKALIGEAVLNLPGSVRALHLYVLSPDGTVRSTERVPIR